MLCEKCKQREATIHFSNVKIDQPTGNLATRHDYCQKCWEKHPPTDGINIDLTEFLEKGNEIKRISENLWKSSRFPSDAFDFTHDVLDAIVVTRRDWYVFAGDALKEFRRLALERFGKNAKSTLANWGIRRTEDFGEIIFAIINAGLLGKHPEETQDDFANGYDFNEAFPEN